METKKMKTLDMVYIALFACLMAICAWISIPGQIPFTLQTMGVFLAVGLLGGKRGTVAVLVYILMGAVGLPVFSGFAFGTAWFMVVYTSSKGAITLGAVLGMCVIPYIIPDAVKIAVALLLTKALKRFVK